MSSSEIAQEQHTLVVRLWIQRCIFDNTGHEIVPGEDSSNLVLYLSQYSTRDLCYRELANRVLDDKTRDPGVLDKVVALLKKNLLRYPPSYETLLYLDHLPAAVSAHGSGARQSLLFLRALVQSQLRRGMSIPTAMARDAQNRKGRNSTFTGGLSFDSPVPLVANFWALGRVEKGDDLPDKRAVSFFEAVQEEGSAVLTIDVFAAPTCDRIAIVADYKMQSGLMNVRQSDHLQKKRQVPKAVVYEKQRELELSEREVRKLVSVVMSEDACGRERHVMASRVLIKVLMDAFLMSCQHGTRLSLHTCLRMVSRDDSPSRLHALNLLFNLSVHANLLCESAIFSTAKPRPSRGTTRGAQAAASEDTAEAREAMARIAEVLDALWLVTAETLGRLSLLQEESSVTWGAALNLVLLHVTDQGKVNFEKLRMLPSRVLGSIVLHVGSLGDDPLRLALALLCNVILNVSPDRKTATLPTDALTQAGLTLHDVVPVFLNARSADTASNAFALLFHHVMAKLRAGAPSASLQRFNEQAIILQAVLAGMGPPYLFRKLFLHALTPEEVRSLSGIVSAVKTQAKTKVTMRNAKKIKNSKLASQLDSQFVSDFFTALLKEGSDYLALDPELEAYKERMLTHPKSLRPLLDTLDELLFSAWPLDRHHGFNWLYDLQVVLMEGHFATSSPRSAAGGGGVSPRTTPVRMGGGRGAKGRGKPAVSPRATAPPNKVPPIKMPPPVKRGRTSPSSSPRPSTMGAASGRRMAAALVSPGRRAPRAGGGGSPDMPRLSPRNQNSPRIPLLAVPETPSSQLRLAGSTPEEQATSLAKMQTLVDETHEKLLLSPDVAVRQGYLDIVRRLVSYVRSRYVDDMDKAIVKSVALIDRHCANVVRRKELHPTILVSMFDIIFDFVASSPPSQPAHAAARDAAASSSSSSAPSGRASAVLSKGALEEPAECLSGGPKCRDTNYMHFLNGARKVSLPLLCRINPAPLKYLFEVLPPAFEDVRVVILILLAALCKGDDERAKRTFQELGHLSWFKALLDDPNPQIAYHASRFLSEYLQAQDPQQYSVALKRLIDVIPARHIAVDYFHVLALLGDKTVRAKK